MDTDFTAPVSSLVEITDYDTGRFLVRTVTSEYLVDLDERRVVRVPSEEAEESGFEVAQLRRDGEEFSLVRLLLCRLSQSMILEASGIADDPEVTTMRMTTKVVGIERIEY